MLPEGDLLRDFHTDLSVGDILRRARLRSGQTLDDIEFIVKISKEHLIAIEEGRIESLPGRIYALGFIRSYANHLSLDSDKIMHLLKRQTGKKLDPPPIAHIETTISDDPTLPSGKAFLMIAGLFIFMVAAGPKIVTYFSNESGAPATQAAHTPPVPHDLIQQMTLLNKPTSIPPIATSTTPQNTNSGEPVQVAENPAPANVHAVVLKAVENVWLEIRDSTGKTIFSRVLSIGEEYWVPTDQTGLVMTLGNAGGLQILVEGETLPFFGKKGKVLRNVMLDSVSLKERLKNIPKGTM